MARAKDTKQGWRTRLERYGPTGRNKAVDYTSIGNKAWETRRSRYGRTKKLVKICLTCGNEFAVPYKAREQKYCCLSCSTKGSKTFLKAIAARTGQVDPPESRQKTWATMRSRYGPSGRSKIANPDFGSPRYIYALIDADSGFIWYVGAAKNPGERAKRHYCRNPLGAATKVISLIATPVGDWETAEMLWIAYFRRLSEPLINIDPGGLGLRNNLDPVLGASRGEKIWQTRRERYGPTGLKPKE